MYTNGTNLTSLIQSFNLVFTIRRTFEMNYLFYLSDIVQTQLRLNAMFVMPPVLIQVRDIQSVMQSMVQMREYILNTTGN
jgi:hypothetical protein